MTKTITQLKKELAKEFTEKLKELGFQSNVVSDQVKFGNKINIISGVSDLRFTLEPYSEKSDEFALFNMTFHYAGYESELSYFYDSDLEYFVKVAPMVYKYCEEYVKVKGLKGFILTASENNASTQMKDALFPSKLLPYFHSFNYLVKESVKSTLIGLYVTDDMFHQLETFSVYKSILKRFFNNEPLFVPNANEETMLDELFFTRVYGTYCGEKIRMKLDENFRLTLDLYESKREPVTISIEMSNLENFFFSLKEEKQTENLLNHPINHFSHLTNELFGRLTDEFNRIKFESLLPSVGSWEVLETESKKMLEQPENKVCELEEKENGVTIIAYMYETELNHYLFIKRNGTIDNKYATIFDFFASKKKKELELTLKSIVDNTIYHF